MKNDGIKQTKVLMKIDIIFFIISYDKLSYWDRVIKFYFNWIDMYQYHKDDGVIFDTRPFAKMKNVTKMYKFVIKQYIKGNQSIVNKIFGP